MRSAGLSRALSRSWEGVLRLSLFILVVEILALSMRLPMRTGWVKGDPIGAQDTTLIHRASQSTSHKIGLICWALTNSRCCLITIHGPITSSRCISSIGCQRLSPDDSTHDSPLGLERRSLVGSHSVHGSGYTTRRLG